MFNFKKIPGDLKCIKMSEYFGNLTPRIHFNIVAHPPLQNVEGFN